MNEMPYSTPSTAAAAFPLFVLAVAPSTSATTFFSRSSLRSPVSFSLPVRQCGPAHLFHMSAELPAVDDDDDGKVVLTSDLQEKIRAVPGFTQFSELLNGRAAMIGFFSALVIEAVTGRGIISIASEFF